ncbi:hypothetical protein CEXT_234701 [Caerostris extrusa]|uniref:Ribosomal protein S10 n=1 Tax=Caerostris extrusa TaxID=172846 RepID=A0AAV4WAY5_CAEEX|nr:hypothetical protein CEXT_234701 [Caerostris extrusa]
MLHQDHLVEVGRDTRAEKKTSENSYTRFRVTIGAVAKNIALLVSRIVIIPLKEGRKSIDLHQLLNASLRPSFDVRRDTRVEKKTSGQYFMTTRISFLTRQLLLFSFELSTEELKSSKSSGDGGFQYFIHIVDVPR